MNAVFPVWLPLLFLILAGCGTRSIIVPVTRPALLDLHRCPEVLVSACDTSLLRESSFPEPGINSLIDEVLYPVLRADGQALWFAYPVLRGRALFNSPDKLSARAVEELRTESGASCVLATSLLEARYDESILSAEIQSTRNPGRVKHVRKGRAFLILEVLLIDARAGRVEFADSIRVELDRETHAVDKEPAAIDIDELRWSLVQQVAHRIAESTKPQPDRDVVTFLLDEDLPVIDSAIVLAEMGRWSAAVALLDSVTAIVGQQSGSDVLWYNLGLTRQYAGDFSGALTAFETARRLNDRGRYRAAVTRLYQAEKEYLERMRQQR